MLKIRRLQVTPVQVPMNYALGTSRARITSAPLLLIDLETEEGVTGRSYLFCYLPAAASAIVKLLAHIEDLIRHHQVSPIELWRKLATHFTLIGVQGIVRMAIAGLDVAAWDGNGNCSRCSARAIPGRGLETYSRLQQLWTGTDGRSCGSRR
jgi:mandelate racemase